jgi:hypothetical protein
MALSAVALSWSVEASAYQEVRDWNVVMGQMEPLSGFFMHSRLAALLHTAVHDAMNSIPGSARYETYRAPVVAQGPASPEAALAAAGRTMLMNYINFYSNQSLPPPFFNASLQALIPQVDSVYNVQLAAVPDGAAKSEGIRIGEQAANNLWNERLSDGWDNPHGYAFQFPNTDGDNNPMTGLPGEYVLLDPSQTFPGAPQPSFYWWGEMTPWAMTSSDAFPSSPPPKPNSIAFKRDLAEVRAYGAVNSSVRTPEQSFAALWWEYCDGVGFMAASLIAQQLVEDFALDNYDAAHTFALMSIAEADALISNVNSKNAYQSWRPITAINHFYPGSNWEPFMFTPPNQEYPAGHPMVSGAAIHLLGAIFGNGQLDNPIVAPSACGDLTFASLKDAVEAVISARVWGGMHFRGSGEEGAATGRKIAHYVYDGFLQPL